MQRHDKRGQRARRLLICAAALAALVVSSLVLRTPYGGAEDMVRAWAAPLQFNAVTLADVR